MGWFDILIGAANTGANLYNASQVEALRRQGAEAALIHAITMYLREQIFTVKQNLLKLWVYQQRITTKRP